MLIDNTKTMFKSGLAIYIDRYKDINIEIYIQVDSIVIYSIG